jgi:hypothetical protein
MNINDLDNKAGFADKYLGPVTGLFTQNFCVVSGVLEKIGRMETETTIKTNSSTGVVGRAGSNGGFGAVSSSNSTTRAEVTRSINLLKIGNTTLTDVGIPSSAFFDAVDLGDEIKAIFSEDQKALYFIYDVKDGSSVGGKPSSSSDLAKWAFLAIAALLAWMTLTDIYEAITTFTMPSIFLPLLSFGSFILYRASSIGSKTTQQNWSHVIEIIHAK